MAQSVHPEFLIALRDLQEVVRELHDGHLFAHMLRCDACARVFVRHANELTNVVRVATGTVYPHSERD